MRTRASPRFSHARLTCVNRPFPHLCELTAAGDEADEGAPQERVQPRGRPAVVHADSGGDRVLA